MGESSQNENLILIEKNQTNENEMYTEKHVERIESENVQTKNDRVEENEEKLQKLHVQRKNWRGHNMDSLCWAIYCVNDGKKVEITSHQVMRCILCYHNVVNIFNSRTQKRKGLITYYKTYGIITLKNM
jgi:predicted phage tail protein